MYVYTTRSGIFTSWNKKVYDGVFFGLAHSDDKWYAVGTHAEDPHVPTNEGYIIRFNLDDESLEIKNVEEIVTGIDNGCHQMCIVGEELYVLETHYQRILVINLKEPSTRRHVTPIEPAVGAWYVKHGFPGSCEHYVHMNAITHQDERFYVMCPHLRNKIEEGNPTQDKNPSTVLVFSQDWMLIDKINLGRYFCHDLVIIGSDIYFSDATNAINKVNIVTHEVTKVWQVEPESPNLRRLCRALTMSPDGQAWAGTDDFENNSYIVDLVTKKQIPSLGARVACMRRLNGHEHVNEMTPRQIVMFPFAMNEISGKIFEKMMAHELDASKFELDFNNKIITEFVDHKRELSPPTEISIQSDLNLPFNIQPKLNFEVGKCTPWHCDNTAEDDGLLDYRMLIVRNTGDSYFMYKCRHTGKIHSFKEIDGSCIVFNARDFEWASICKTGIRMSHISKFGRDVLCHLRIENIWERDVPMDVIDYTYNNMNKSMMEFHANSEIPEALVNSLRVRLADQPLHIATVGMGTANKTARRSRITWVPKNAMFMDIYGLIYNLVADVNSNLFKFNITGLGERLQYTEYNANEKGHYDWHTDIGASNSNRKLAVIIQLSDPSEYEGGNLEIMMGADPLIAPKKKGTICIFPTFAVHRVTPVTKGIRRSLVTWVTGPPFV